MPHRRWILQTLGALGLSTLPGQTPAMGVHPLPPGIRSIKGSVRINDSPAREGQIVLEGDSIRTARSSEVVYVMGSNAYLLREDSQVHYRSEGAVTVLRIISGKVLSVFGPGPKRIEMPTVTAGIRGTACYVEASESQTYFCLCYGTADLSPTADPGQARTVTTQYHDSPFTIGNDAGVALITPAPVINHRDAELTMLEALVGRRPPFKTSERLGGGY